MRKEDGGCEPTNVFGRYQELVEENRRRRESKVEEQYQRARTRFGREEELHRVDMERLPQHSLGAGMTDLLKSYFPLMDKGVVGTPHSFELVGCLGTVGEARWYVKSSGAVYHQGVTDWEEQGPDQGIAFGEELGISSVLDQRDKVFLLLDGIGSRSDAPRITVPAGFYVFSLGVGEPDYDVGRSKWDKIFMVIHAESLGEAIKHMRFRISPPERMRFRDFRVATGDTWKRLVPEGVQTGSEISRGEFCEAKFVTQEI
jgi:hypothetical protein